MTPLVKIFKRSIGAFFSRTSTLMSKMFRSYTVLMETIVEYLTCLNYLGFKAFKISIEPLFRYSKCSESQSAYRSSKPIIFMRSSLNIFVIFLTFLFSYSLRALVNCSRVVPSRITAKQSICAL